MSNTPPTDLRRLLRPRAVAIVGASPTPGALGASVLENLERNGFAGEVHLINPKRDEIKGRPCLKSVWDLPDGVDAAVLAIPRSAVLGTINDLAQRGVGSAVIFSAGFAEAGEAGLGEQEEIARIAGANGMVVLGPNCLGLVNHVDRVPLTFVQTQIEASESTARVSIVSQSGAMAAVLSVSLASRKAPLAFSISTGNEAVTGVEDYLEHLVDDPLTRVIAMIVEQFRRPHRFLAAARRARLAGKTIVLLHPGKSSAARESAATHTGAMAGDYAVMRAKVEREGVVLAETLEELGDIAEIALRCPRLPSGGTAILGESGAFKALMLDFSEHVGLELPTLSDETAPALRAALPDFVGVSNPLDLTAQGLVDPDLYQRALTALMEDERFGLIIAGIIQGDPATIGIKAPPILQAVRESERGKPLIFAGLDEGAEVPSETIDALRGLGVPYFPSSERVIRAVKRLMDLSTRDLSVVERSVIELAGLPAGPQVIPEYRSKALLSPLGIPFPAGRFVTSVEDACDAADALGYPVVLKAQATALPHKSDAGGVILALENRAAVVEAWARLLANIEAYEPGLKLDGVLVEAMGKRGVELIVGARNDPDWGPVVLFGFGGVQAELLHDFRLAPADLPSAAIRTELYRLKSAALFDGFRGSPALDVEAVRELIERVGQLMVSAPQIAEIDLNPVVIHPRGEGVVALDALMTIREL